MQGALLTDNAKFFGTISIWFLLIEQDERIEHDLEIIDTELTTLNCIAIVVCSVSIFPTAQQQERPEFSRYHKIHQYLEEWCS